MQGCPACRRLWPDDREVCPDCLADLVDDLDATLTCTQCGRVCPSRMQACPACFALLRADDIDLGPALELAVGDGRSMPRPIGRRAFADGIACSLERAGGAGGLVLRGVDGFVEARLGPGRAARAPLVCESDDGLLFRLLPYAAADRAVVAVGPDGASIATFLRTGGVLDGGLGVRDETSAPVGHLGYDDGGWYHLAETGGGVIGRAQRTLVDAGDGWEDDRWSVAPCEHDGRPMAPLAWIALVVAAKVLLGRETATRVVDGELLGLERYR